MGSQLTDTGAASASLMLNQTVDTALFESYLRGCLASETHVLTVLNLSVDSTRSKTVKFSRGAFTASFTLEFCETMHSTDAALVYFFTYT